MLKMISLFSGIGGFELAARWVGIEMIASVEINPFCQKVLTKHFPNTPIYNDVTSYSPEIGKAQIVCGGSPCQDLSIAGEQKGIIKGKRSSLWFEQLRIYKESRATFLVWENVAGAFRNGFREVLRSLSESGYDAEWQVVSAAALGAPHLRERIFLIAYPNGLFRKAEGWSNQVGDQVAIASTYPDSLTTHSRKKNTEIKGSESSFDESQAGIKWEDLQCRGLSKISLLPSRWSSVKPPVCGVDAGLSHRLDRLSALGNAIVPQCAVIPLLRVKYLAELIA